MNKQELIEKYESLKGIWNNPGSIPALECFLQDLYQLTEPQIPVIPQFVAEWYDYAKKQNFSLRQALEHWSMSEELVKWFQYSNNQETFARAWLDGYTIEQEKLYWVRNRQDISLLYKQVNGSIAWSSGYEPEHQEEFRKDYTFTEKEIKDYDERYWAFAIPVEVE